MYSGKKKGFADSYSQIQEKKFKLEYEFKEKEIELKEKEMEFKRKVYEDEKVSKKMELELDRQNSLSIAQLQARQTIAISMASTLENLIMFNSQYARMVTR